MQGKEDSCVPLVASEQSSSGHIVLYTSIISKEEGRRKMYEYNEVRGKMAEG